MKISVLEHPLGLGLLGLVERLGRHVHFPQLPASGLHAASEAQGRGRVVQLSAYMRSESDLKDMILGMIRHALRAEAGHAAAAGSWTIPVPADIAADSGAGHDRNQSTSGVLGWGLPFLVFRGSGA